MMGRNVATGEQFSTGLGVMGKDGMHELFFALVGRSEVEKMQFLAKNLGLLSNDAGLV